MDTLGRRTRTFRLFNSDNPGKYPSTFSKSTTGALAAISVAQDKEAEEAEE